VVAIEDGLKMVMDLAREKARPDRMPVESVALPDSVNRILREDIVSDADSPPFDKAIRDGFAVRSEDVASVPSVLEVVSESRAGFAADRPVVPQTACEIMTGAPMPAGANAVVMVEHTERLSPSQVRILRSAREGEGLLRRAAELKKDERILLSGRRIQLADIGTLASVGKASVAVSRRPSVAILATGDELVAVSEQPEFGQIRNSNSFTLHAQVLEAGAEPVLLGIGRDNLEDLRQKIGQGLQHDILLVSGGVSMGKYDFVENVFDEFGVKVLFDKVAMKPGKPTVFGHRNDTYVFGLPGNPVSTIVAFHMFVRPLILHLLKAEQTGSRVLRAKVESPERSDPARTAIVPALVRFDGECYTIRSAPWKGSSDLAGLSRANALIIIPRGEAALQPGEWAQFIPLE
jgi:molybdopterin molybdotransferase